MIGAKFALAARMAFLLHTRPGSCLCLKPNDPARMVKSDSPGLNAPCWDCMVDEVVGQWYGWEKRAD